MSRRIIAYAALAVILLVIGLDVTASPPNPYTAPSVFALGSGAAPSGGFCGALPD
ncbi:hypothetical protein [Roseovarius dicentrarchi]|uniref:hypothetical protein n=1 Tax=Roseovarius dicentrarchi TaxID=2250573 RepID=UPI0013966C16|nr:hypothetical protein [Roseovarius dicentrarchi]